MRSRKNPIILDGFMQVPKEEAAAIVDGDGWAEAVLSRGGVCTTL